MREEERVVEEGQWPKDRGVDKRFLYGEVRDGKRVATIVTQRLQTTVAVELVLVANSDEDSSVWEFNNLEENEEEKGNKIRC